MSKFNEIIEKSENYRSLLFSITGCEVNWQNIDLTIFDFRSTIQASSREGDRKRPGTEGRKMRPCKRGNEPSVQGQ